MNDNTLFELTLFDPENTLIALFEKREIEYRKIPATRKYVVAMDEAVEVVSTDNREILIENLVSVFVAWLTENRYRKLQVQLVDGSTVYIDKKDTQGAINILDQSLKVTAFDPEYNNRILSK